MTNFIPHQLGKQAETLAIRFLRQQGLQLITTNYRTKFGEIDIIMQEQNKIVFVEVRLRKYLGYASGEDSIDQNKRKKIIQTAIIYLQREKLTEKIASRFDVVALAHKQNQIHSDVLWIRDAFRVE